MTDQGKRRPKPKRSQAAVCFDEMTLAAFVTVLIVTTVVVVRIGVPTVVDRLGCELNDIVNVLMAYPRACH